MSILSSMGRLWDRILPQNRAMGLFYAREQKKILTELYWATIFNSTVQQSSWLLKKNFSPGRWAVGYPFLYVLYRILDEVNPRNILELGLGQSTKMISQYADHFLSAAHIIVEHDAEWGRFFQSGFPLSVNSQLLMLPCKKELIRQVRTNLYDGFEVYFKDKSFDLLVIDGPITLEETTHSLSRIDILPLLPQLLAKEFVLLFDDYQFLSIRNTITVVKEKLNENNIVFHSAVYSGEKELCMIVSDGYQFLTTL